MAESFSNIRFVGGPWDNQHKTITRLLNHVLIPETSVPSIEDCPGPSGPTRRHIYELTKMESEGGAVFYEYVYKGMQ